MVTLLIMTDGRMKYITQTISSFEEKVSGTITRKVISDDSGSMLYNEWLTEYYGDQGFEIIGGTARLGYSGAVQRAWSYLHDDSNRFTFHLEDDFTFNRPVDLDELAGFLDEKWWLAQIALRRGRWGTEIKGFVEDSPQLFKQCVDLHHAWLQTRAYYTMTPHLYRSRLRQLGWPSGDHGETNWTARLLETGLPWRVKPAHVQFGFWGGVEDGADAVTHIGHERMGYGY